MNRIVRENYPVSELPDDLRADLPQNGLVRVIIEPLGLPSEQVLSLDELWAMRRGPYKSTDEIVSDVRRMRDEWDA